ncbi:hypothetical protein [Candidatus Odyssella acanthamoebae]|uniref:Uncharacterized protein n=1 Tax=Candidatus Odyssella acanthamoebae TaxID=91604 RepID=A0A077AT55_9PROT|nr:hypothetical protein [Candidatus Paracaedibacter acanthamoebae]AIK95551.1 hypothetical protein ID47_00390 [Candidatus Paracaedibacter acanthamoebae]
MTLYHKHKKASEASKAKAIGNKSDLFFNNIDLFIMLLAILALLILPLMFYYLPEDLELMELADQMEMLLWYSKSL